MSGAAGSGTSGMGGMGMGCPGTAPMNDSMCNTDDNPDDCTYGTTVCECGGPPMGPEGTWTCNECPAMQPMDGSPCDPEVNDECDYDDTTCECGGDDTWECEM
jgi:hypothetical protein